MTYIVECARCGRTFVREAARMVDGKVHCSQCAQLVAGLPKSPPNPAMRRRVLLGGGGFLVVLASGMGIYLGLTTSDGKRNSTTPPVPKTTPAKATSQVLAQGAGVEWTILNKEVNKLYRAGNYDRAVTVAKKALEVADKNAGPNHSNVATSLNSLASLYYTQGQYAQAEPLYKRALAIREKALGPNHPHVARDLDNLAGLYYTQGQYAQAESLGKRALGIYEKALGPNHPDVAMSLKHLARLFRKTGREKDAKKMEDRAARIRAIKR
jgi:tetratricopeptide (TPR) repeat protein